LKIKGGKKQLKCTPPHDVPGTPFADVLIQAETQEAKTTAGMLNDLIIRSQELLENHPVNLKRAAAEKTKPTAFGPGLPVTNPT